MASQPTRLFMYPQKKKGFTSEKFMVYKAQIDKDLLLGGGG